MAFKGWKKVADEKDHAVLRHETGHEMKVAKAGLSPKMRGQLAEIPVHSDANNPKLQQSKAKPPSKEAVAEDKGKLRLANGGGAWSQADKEAFARGASGGAGSGAGAQMPHQVKMAPAQVFYSHPGEDTTGNSIAAMQSANLADPSKADRLAATNAAIAKFNARQEPAAPVAAPVAAPSQNVFSATEGYADGGEVGMDGQPTEIAPGVPAEASNPNVYDFEQRKAMIAKGMGDTFRPSNMNMPPEMQSDPSIDQAVTTKALDQLDTEKAAGTQAAASVGADQGAAYQQAVDLNKRLAAQGLPQQPLPPMPSGGAPQPDPAPNQGAPSPSMGGMQPPGNDDPYGTGATQDAYMRGIGEQKAGIMGEARALGAQGQAEAKVAHDSAVNKQNLLDNYQNENATLNAQRQEFMQHLQNQKIDPNHYLGEMSTMGRIGNAIGLILGGMGSGLTGGKNPALEMLNANIDRDIRAQEANLGTSKSLLEFNQQQFGNLRDAKEMTRAMMNDVTSAKLKEAAAKSQDPLAKARALQAAGQLDQQTAANVGQYAMRKTMLQGMRDGKVAPASFIEFALPQADRPAARKELSEAQEGIKARDNVLGAFDKIDHLQTIGSRVGSPVQSKAQIDALRGPVVAALSKATAGRFTEQDSQMLEPLFPKLSDDMATRMQKRQALTRLINEKLNYPTLDAYHINPVKQGGRFNEQGQSKFKEMAPVAPKKR